MPELDLWQQPNGWPRDAYFETVHDALVATGIKPDDWHHAEPWEAAIVLGADALKGSRFERYDEVVVSWRVDQDRDPKHVDDFDGEGWYLVLSRDGNQQIRDLPGLPYLPEPDHVAHVVAEKLHGGAR